VSFDLRKNQHLHIINKDVNNNNNNNNNNKKLVVTRAGVMNREKV